jgi:hypothetical protein
MIHHKLAIYILLGSLPMALIGSANKAKYVDFVPFFGINSHFIIRELPAIGNIALATHTSLIAIKKVYQSFFSQAFQLLQIGFLRLINLLIGLALTTFSYPFISSTKLFKKRLKVLLLTRFPLEASHSALAVAIFWRCCFTASKIALSSSILSIRGFLPRPGLIDKPDIPSDLYRFSQLFTLTLHIPTILPTSFESRPSAFNSIVWQRFRRLWFLDSLKSFSNSVFCDSLKSGVFTRPMRTNIQNNKNYLWFSTYLGSNELGFLFSCRLC